jgi:death-on-curing protein
LAATLLAGIVQNHPFIEGNKRTALVAARTFLVNNGYDIGLSDDELGPLVKDFAAGHLAEADLCDVIEAHLIDAPF